MIYQTTFGVAKIAGCSVATVNRIVKRLKIKPEKYGSCNCFTPEQIRTIKAQIKPVGNPNFGKKVSKVKVKVKR